MRDHTFSWRRPPFGKRTHVVRVLVIVLVIAASPLFDSASADRRFFPDGNDTPGRLDIRRSAHGHDGNKVVHRVRMQRAWRNRLLRKQENWVGVGFNTDVDRAWEHFVWIRYRKAKGLVATLYRDDPQYPVRVRNVSVWRPGSRSVAIAFRPSLLGLEKGERYRWFAATSFEGSLGSKCPSPGYEVDDAFPPEGACQDRAPNGDRFYRH